MKLIHLSDLHLGLRMHGFSLLEDQRFILRQILSIIDEEAPDGVILAGDLYDKAVPPAEAVRVFDDFLVSLVRRRLQVFIIAGNHDSPERIAFGGRVMDASGIHLSPVYDGKSVSVPMKDEWGTVRIHLLPFLRPAAVRAAFPEEAEGISSYTDALRTAIGHIDLDPGERHVLAAHQFVTGAERSESEDVNVGGADNVDAEVFAAFDYTALGHIHRPQQAGSPRMRYCGTPLKYSFSERNHQKSVTVAELREKGSLTLRTVPLLPLHDVREVRGTYEALTLRSAWEGTPREDYLHIILTDEEDVPDAMPRLRSIYPNLMKLTYDNTRTRSLGVLEAAGEPDQRTEMELFAAFYEKQNGQPLTEEQTRFAQALLEKVREEDA